jgi:hypothetical protein
LFTILHSSTFGNNAVSVATVIPETEKANIIKKTCLHHASYGIPGNSVSLLHVLFNDAVNC